MESVKTTAEYLARLPEDRLGPIERLVSTIRDHLPTGFHETISYGMLGWVVPHERYPPGYHVDPKLPLPFLNLASQKNHIALYHMGLYSDDLLLRWFVAEYPKHSKSKLNMGKSCIRFKNLARIPYDLIGELCTRMTPAQWIQLYETQRQSNGR